MTEEDIEAQASYNVSNKYNQSQPFHNSITSSPPFAYFLIFLSACTFAIATICQDRAEKTFKFPPIAAIFVRGAAEVLFAMIYLSFGTEMRTLFQSLSKHNWKLLALHGILGTLKTACFAMSLNYLSSGDASAILFSFPVVVYLLSYLMLNQRMAIFDIASVLGVFFGIILIAGPFSEVSHARASGSIFAAIGAILVAAYVLLYKRIRRTVNFIIPVLTCNVCVVVLSAAVGGFMSPTQLLNNGKGSWYMFLSAIVSFFSECTLSIALKYCRADRASLFRTTEVPFSYLLGAIFLNQRPSTMEILGSSLIIFGITVIGLGQVVEGSQEDEKSMPLLARTPHQSDVESEQTDSSTDR